MTAARKAAQQPPVPPTICEARERLGWDVERLALESLLSPQQIYKIEEGLHVPAHQLQKVAEALGLTVDQLSTTK